MNSNSYEYDDDYLLSDDEENYGNFRIKELKRSELIKIYIDITKKSLAEQDARLAANASKPKQRKACKVKLQKEIVVKGDNFMKALGLNVVQQILSFLPPVTAYFAALTCTTWNQILCANKKPEKEYQEKNTKRAKMALKQKVTNMKFHIMNVVARHGFVSCLKYLHVECNFKLDENTCAWAASTGQLDCLKYLHENGIKWNDETCTNAAEGGHLACLKYAYKNGCQWNESTCAGAAKNGQLACLQYAYRRGCNWNPKQICKLAALGGHLDVLKYARENRTKWDCYTTIAAAMGGSLECMKYAHENGCPWEDDNLMYDGGHNATDYAAKNGHLACLKHAHENGCPLGISVGYYAVKHNRYDCLKYALANGVVPDDEGREMPIAARKGNLEIVKLLRQHGYDWSDAAQEAAKAGQFECLKWMVDNHCTWGEYFGWDYGDEEYDVKCLVYALEHGFDPDEYGMLWKIETDVEMYLQEQGVGLTAESKNKLQNQVRERNERERISKAEAFGDSEVFSTMKMNLYKRLIRARKELDDFDTLSSCVIRALCNTIPTTPTEVNARLHDFTDLDCKILSQIISSFMEQNGIQKLPNGTIVINGVAEKSHPVRTEESVRREQLQELYRRLLEARTEIKQTIHAHDYMNEYAIIGTDIVQDLATQMPTTEAKLIAIIGEKKAKLYANILLRVIRNFKENYGIHDDDESEGAEDSSNSNSNDDDDDDAKNNDLENKKPPTNIYDNENNNNNSIHEHHHNINNVSSFTNTKLCGLNKTQSEGNKRKLPSVTLSVQSKKEKKTEVKTEDTTQNNNNEMSTKTIKQIIVEYTDGTRAFLPLPPTNSTTTTTTTTTTTHTSTDPEDMDKDEQEDEELDNKSKKAKRE